MRMIVKAVAGRRHVGVAPLYNQAGNETSHFRWGLRPGPRRRRQSRIISETFAVHPSAGAAAPVQRQGESCEWLGC